MEKLRQKMHEYIEKYGVLDERTVAVSQELDLYIVEAMKNKITKTAKSMI